MFRPLWTIQGNKLGPGIPIAAVNEGLATVFSEEYTGEYFDATYSYPENAAEWLQEILALPGNADYSTWMVGEHPDGRNIGHRIELLRQSKLEGSWACSLTCFLSNDCSSSASQKEPRNELSDWQELLGRCARNKAIQRSPAADQFGRINKSLYPCLRQ